LKCEGEFSLRRIDLIPAQFDRMPIYEANLTILFEPVCPPVYFETATIEK